MSSKEKMGEVMFLERKRVLIFGKKSNNRREKRRRDKKGGKPKDAKRKEDRVSKEMLQRMIRAREERETFLLGNIPNLRELQTTKPGPTKASRGKRRGKINNQTSIGQ